MYLRKKEEKTLGSLEKRKIYFQHQTVAGRRVSGKYLISGQCGRKTVERLINHFITILGNGAIRVKFEASFRLKLKSR
jgi:hypothetical protein